MTLQQATQDSYIEINPNSPPDKCVIWLHGLGADGSDFVSLVPELRLPPSLAVRFIFPHAPTMPVTLNSGYVMRAWFDIYDARIESKIDETGIYQSKKLVEELIQNEISRGIAPNNIILAGFSQGAVMALITGLSYPQPLGGLIALSGFLPLAEKILQQTAPANCHLPLFIAHGTEDAMVPYPLGKATYVTLSQAGHPASWHSYPMGHGVCAEEIEDISHWMQTIWH